MPVHEFPIQRGEGTRVFADSFFVIKTTAFAEVTHLVDVVAAAAVRFCANNTAVPELAHAERVRQRHPVDRVNIHGHVPFVKQSRMNAPQLSKIAQHHKAMNVV